jgi:glycosyltransferase involved in cell wall biosynthesis
VEENIKTTLASVLTQDYENIEIILVNDASTDKTVQAAKLVLEKSSRPWRIIEHETNKGVSEARNTGMREAHGGYIQFMDADDLVDADFISTLIETAAEHDADVVFCGYRTRETANGAESMAPIRMDPNKTYSSEALALKFICGEISTGLWAMLFKHDLLAASGVVFTAGCVAGEDNEFAVKVMSVCQNIAFSKKCGYIYCLHEKMGTRARNATPEQRLYRYTDNIRGQFRAARFIIKHSKSRGIVNAARHILLPRLHLKMFAIFAWRGDHEKFMKALRSPKIRAILWSSRKAFFRKPQILLKSICLFAFPTLYYNYRRKNVYGYRV